MDTAIAKVAFGGNAIATEMNETLLPSFIRRPIPPKQVARAVVRGLQQRKPRIIVPTRLVPFSMLRGLFNMITDWHMQRHSRLQKLLQQLESEVARTRKQVDEPAPELKKVSP